MGIRTLVLGPFYKRKYGKDTYSFALKKLHLAREPESQLKWWLESYSIDKNATERIFSKLEEIHVKPIGLLVHNLVTHYKEDPGAVELALTKLRHYQERGKKLYYRRSDIVKLVEMYRWHGKAVDTAFDMAYERILDTAKRHPEIHPTLHNVIMFMKDYLE